MTQGGRGLGATRLGELLVAFGLTLTAALGFVITRADKPLWLLILLLGASLAVRTLADSTPGTLDGSAGLIAMVLGVAGAAFNTFVMATTGAGGGAIGSVLLVASAATAAGLCLTAGDRWRVGWLTPAMAYVVIMCVISAFWVAHTPTVNDVELVLREGSRETLAGGNPYAMTFPNIYDAARTAYNYGPGYLVNGRVAYGFPYPPIVLLFALPSYLVGDVRFTSVIALAVIAIAIHGGGEARHRRVAAVLAMSAPGVAFMLQNGWTELFSLSLLALAVVSLRLRHYLVAALFLGAFFASKQYLVAALPCLWLLRTHITHRRTLVFLAPGLVTIVPWLVADPAALWRSTLGVQSTGGFRDDSLSMTTAAAEAWGLHVNTFFIVLPPMAGLACALLVATLAKPTTRNFLIGTGLSAFATIALSKQGFFNYYVLVAFTSLLAASLCDAQTDGPKPTH